MTGLGWLDDPKGTVSWGYNKYADCHKKYGCTALGIITSNNLDGGNTYFSDYTFSKDF